MVMPGCNHFRLMLTETALHTYELALQEHVAQPQRGFLLQQCASGMHFAFGAEGLGIPHCLGSGVARGWDPINLFFIKEALQHFLNTIRKCLHSVENTAIKCEPNITRLYAAGSPQPCIQDFSLFPATSEAPSITPCLWHCRTMHQPRDIKQ